MGPRKGMANGKKAARDLLCKDFAAYKALVREVFSSPLYRKALVSEFEEDSDRVIEVRVSACLWEKTFREAGASDLGYVTFCCTDIGFFEDLDPKVRLSRTKCLMKGDDYCNHRWVLEG